MNKFTILILVMTLLCSILPSPVLFAADDENYGVYTKAQINATKERIAMKDPETLAAFNQFKARVDNWCMERTCHAVSEYRIYGYYDRPEDHITASKNLTHDAYSAYATALAWQLTGEDKYAAKAKELLNGWATINNEFRWWDDTPLVGAYGGVALIYAAELITDYNSWTAAEQNTFKSWVTNKYRPAIDSIKGRTNNWGSWAVLALIATDHYLNNQMALDTWVNVTLPGLINSQINPYGKLPQEIDRGFNGMWYTYFSLAPLTQAAQLAYNVKGVNYFDTGSCATKLKNALNFYLPYVTNPDLWDQDFKETKYPGETLVRPTMSNGSQSLPNWPTNMYLAMVDIYGSEGTEYADLVGDYEPIMGGWTEREAHHIAWSFPSLIKATTLISEPLPLPESISDNFEADKLSPYWEVQRFALDGSVSGVNGELSVDPDDANNKALKLTDTMKGAWATTGSTGCVEVLANMKPVSSFSESSFDIKFAGSKSYMSGAHILDTEHNDAIIASIMVAENGKLILRRPNYLGGLTSDYELTDSAIHTNKWYNIRIIINPTSKTVDVYIDHELRCKNQYFRSSAAVNMTRVKFTTDSSADATIN